MDYYYLMPTTTITNLITPDYTNNYNIEGNIYNIRVCTYRWLHFYINEKTLIILKDTDKEVFSDDGNYSIVKSYNDSVLIGIKQNESV